MIGTIGEVGEPKCIKAGCNNKRASDSNYCYLHESSGSRYSSYGSSTYHSKSSDSSSAGNSESTNRSYSSDTKKNSSGKSTYDCMMMRWTRLGRIGNGALCVRER